MASNARVSNKQGAQGKQKLRVIATAAAGCGIFMNIIALIAIAKDRRFGGSKRLLSGAFVPVKPHVDLYRAQTLIFCSSWLH